MNTTTTNRHSSNRWVRLTRSIRRFLGLPVTFAVTAAILYASSMGGCKDEDQGIVTVCVAPTVISTTPGNGGTNESLSKTGGPARVAAVKVITATFSTPMDARTINTSTFTMRQGVTPVAGSVSYSDTTAVFIVPNGLSSNLSYTCTITTGVKDLAGTALASNYVWTFSTTGPGVPTLVAPTNSAVNQPVNPTMVWNTVAGAATYRLQVSSSAGFATTVYNDSTLSNTSQQVSGLAVATTYFWRVNSKIAGGTSAYSSVWSFTTVAPPAAPVLVSPANAAISQPTSLTLSWNASTGASTYRLQVDTNASFTSTLVNDSTLSGTSYPLASLTTGTTYYWRVNAKNSAGTSAYSSVRTFTTITPGTPTLVAPADLAVNQSVNPTLIWNVVAGADTYRLQVSLLANFASTFYNDSTLTSTSQQVNGLAVGTTYYWRVNSKISGTTSSYSAVWSFTTIAPPAAPALVAPVAGALNQPTNPTLSWLASSGADTYRLQVSTSAAFASTVFNDSTITGTSQPISGLLVSTTYFWRVNAKNVAGTSSYSTVRSFTTIAPPAAPVLVSPLAGAQNQPTNLTLSWLASSGADSYRLQVSTSAVFATTIYNDSTITGTSQPISGLLVGTTYFWRVNAKNAAGTSSYSSRSFTTSLAVPAPPFLSSPNDLDTVITTSPTLSWLASVGAATYRLQVDTSAVFASTVFDDSTITGLSQPVSGLINGKTYFWRVNAKNSGGTSAYSQVWRFMVAPLPPPPTSLLGVAATYGIMATSAITSTGNSIINGDVSLDPGTSMTGFPPAIVNGAIHINDLSSDSARADLLIAYNDLKNLPPGTTVGAGADLGALYPLGIPPGTYTSGSTMLVSTPLVLDAGGNANAVWVFQIGSSLTTGADVTLTGGAKANNVYWVPTLDATIGVGTTFHGTIVSGRDVTAVTGSTINGRILAGATTAGTIALQNAVVNVPSP